MRILLYSCYATIFLSSIQTYIFQHSAANIKFDVIGMKAPDAIYIILDAGYQVTYQQYISEVYS